MTRKVTGGLRNRRPTSASAMATNAADPFSSAGTTARDRHGSRESVNQRGWVLDLPPATLVRQCRRHPEGQFGTAPVCSGRAQTCSLRFAGNSICRRSDRLPPRRVPSPGDVLSVSACATSSRGPDAQCRTAINQEQRCPISREHVGVVAPGRMVLARGRARRIRGHRLHP